MELLTIGHSNRTLEEFLSVLTVHGAELLADLRTVPRSRHNPQFNRETLPLSLATAGIQYLHMPELGGLRHARKDSVNTGWRNASFRGYADYMQTAAFRNALEELLRTGSQSRTVLMCAEAVPWRCHRSLVADALLVRGIGVRHILSGRAPSTHRLTPFASITGEQLTYPASASPLEA